jgi:hypothetical protein
MPLQIALRVALESHERVSALDTVDPSELAGHSVSHLIVLLDANHRYEIVLAGY